MGSAERYRKAKALFNAALERTTVEREPFVRDACAGDDALAREVLDLLAAHVDAATEFLEPIVVPPPPATTSIDLARLGADRGYRVLHEHARGGMGVVYLAERADGAYRQKVALKLLSAAALLQPEASLRLKLEREILARLNHPNIARLLDGGTSSEGAPYLVMEYVEGERIDRWCERERASLERRIDLFLAVCDAVAYAHRNLVVHRDLKPGNVLVTADGVPKLLDFGIAKLLASDDAELTGTGERLMTPRYASPEQVLGKPVTTLSDVYSLGVVLYELLAEVTPYGEAASTPLTLPHAICETDPTPPSIALAKTTERFIPARRLRGDLDAIVLKALRKPPEQRYGSVEELAADLRAHREGRPVGARAGSRLYRVRRLARRHWKALATAAAVLVLSTGFVLRLARELDATARERDRADRVVEFLVGVFQRADPMRGGGEKVSVRQVVDQGAARVDEELRAQPAIRATLLHTLGRVYDSLGEYTKAQQLLEQARELRRDGDPLEYADTLRELAAVALDRQDGPAAKKLLEEARAIVEPRVKPDDLRVAMLVGELARAHGEAGDRDAEERLAKQSLALLLHRIGATEVPTKLPPRAAQGEEYARIATALHNLARISMMRGELETAQAQFERALAFKRQVYPPNDPAIATTLNALANVISDRGLLNESLAPQQEALAIRIAAFGPDHPIAALSYFNLAVNLKQIKRYDEALEDYGRALAIFTKAYGADHANVLTIRNNIANVHMARQDYKAALAAHEALLATREALLGREHLDVAQSLINLGICYRELGRVDDAIAADRRALEIQRKAQGEFHPETIGAIYELVLSLRAGDHGEEAERWLRETLPHVGGENEHKVLAAAMQFEWAQLIVKRHGDLAQARALAEQARDTVRAVGVNEYLEAAEIERWLAAHAGGP